ncbi:MAG: hypothetical protein ACSLEN_12520 [Candidatus Malihini olakiniferum]
MRNATNTPAHCEKLSGLSLPIIATGHLTTTGITASKAVRDIYIVSLDAYPLQAPPRRTILRSDTSTVLSVWGIVSIFATAVPPITLSFDELSSEKSVALIEFQQGAPIQITLLPIPVTQPMRLIKGSLKEIEQQL